MNMPLKTKQLRCNSLESFKSKSLHEPSNKALFNDVRFVLIGQMTVKNENLIWGKEKNRYILIVLVEIYTEYMNNNCKDLNYDILKWIIVDFYFKILWIDYTHT